MGFKREKLENGRVLMDTDKLRLSLGLPTLKPGVVKCLGINCDKDFLSWDKSLNRICPECKRRIEAEDEEKDEVYFSDMLEIEYNMDLEEDFGVFVASNEDIVSELQLKYRIKQWQDQ